jgi:hypothetical protein
MNEILRVMLALLLAPYGYTSAQQESNTATGTYVTAAEIKAVLDAVKDRPVADLNARTVSAGPNNVLVNIARRTEAGMPADSGLAHRNLTEVYYVIGGAGVLVTGGKLKGAEETPGGSGNIRGQGIDGGESRRIQVGDVIVIPASTPHAFSSIEGTIVYLNIRIDPVRR